MLQVMSIVVVLALAQPNIPTTRTRFPYWQMVSEVVEQIESRRPRPTSVSGTLQTPGQEYPFEAFRHLRVVDLLRAAKEGIEEAKLQAALGKSDVEVTALVRRNIALALEYLPLLIKSDADMEEIIVIIGNRNEEPELRRYLLKHTVSGFAPPSLLAFALPELMDPDNKMFQERLSTMASHPGEVPDIQILAIKTNYHRLREQYIRIFEADPAVVSARESGAAPSFASAVEDDGQTLDRDVRAQLMRQGRRFEFFAENIAGHIAEGSVRDEQVKALTQSILEEIRDAFLGVNKAKLDAWIEGRVFVEEPTFPGLPGFPTVIPDVDSSASDFPFPVPAGVTIMPAPGAAPF